jgi:hypothetical protein
MPRGFLKFLYSSFSLSYKFLMNVQRRSAELLSHKPWIHPLPIAKTLKSKAIAPVHLGIYIKSLSGGGLMADALLRFCDLSPQRSS